MKVIRVNFWRLCSCFSFIFNIIKKVLGRGKGRRNSNDARNTKQLPTSITTVQQHSEQAELDDWDQWGKQEEFSIKVEPSIPAPSDSQPNSEEVDLFQDMQPVFHKTKKIRVKKTSPHNLQELNYHAAASSRLNFDMRYTTPETELGTWVEESASAWDEGVSEKEIELETENVFKEKKKAERERRMLEQKRKKEEKEMTRAARKPTSGFGVKVA